MFEVSGIYLFLKALLDPVIFIFFTVLLAGIFILKNRKGLKSKFLLAFSFLFLYAAAVSPVANMLCYFMERDYIAAEGRGGKKTDVVVVLGGGMIRIDEAGKMTLSAQSAARLLKAVQVFNASGAEYLVCSGRGSDITSEAELMKAAAERLGVPEKSIKIDTKSENTKEHAIELDRMFKDKNITVGLVTSAYHMKRSEREFRKYFPSVVAFPSDYMYFSSPLSVHSFLPNSYNLSRVAIVIREIAGILWYMLRG